MNYKMQRRPCFLHPSIYPRVNGTVHHRNITYYPSRLQHQTLKSCSSANLSNQAKLVTPEWLSDRLASPEQSVRVLDARGRVAKVGGRVTEGLQPVKYISDKDAYIDDGHIPHATFIDWRDIDLWQPDALLDELADHGVQQDGTVCIYDWGDMLFATRVWLGLLSLGCSDVRVLDGGWEAWTQHYAHKISFDSACRLTLYRDFYGDKEGIDDPDSASRARDLSVNLAQMREIVDVNKHGGIDSGIIIDARSAKLYSGLERRARHAGHIPKALNLPYRELLNDNGVGLKSFHELKQRLAKLTMGPDCTSTPDIITYCNGGVASSLVMFCLTMCGFGDEHKIRNYCGSFNEWGNLDDAPIDVS